MTKQERIMQEFWTQKKIEMLEEENRCLKNTIEFMLKQIEKNKVWDYFFFMVPVE